jgi:L-ascorbate metabolism protein UlaG (beta-lactamase superfamily)
MRIKWYGHAAFLLSTDRGTRVIIDPYQSGAFGGALTYGKITDRADLVLTSHDHEDHCYIKDIPGPFKHISSEGAYNERDVRVRALPSFHDPSQGRERGKNLMFLIHADGLTLAHLGDLGHTLDGEAVRNLGAVDVLVLPVGGFFTVGAGDATTVMEAVRASITIPMHYKTEKCAFSISGVAEFTAGKNRVKRIDGSEVSISKESLPPEPEIYVMDYAL